MVNWQVTATTLYCDTVNDEVTILVYKDWSVKCTGYNKYSNTGKKNERSKQKLECTGPNCQRAIQYREKLQSEENKRVKKV